MEDPGSKSGNAGSVLNETWGLCVFADNIFCPKALSKQAIDLF
jgi:hypothetical protein